jgi:nucleotide-binding universal stress UspA family protein
MRHIMIATDGTEGADRAVDVVAELSKASGGKLFIVAVAGNLGEETQELAGAKRNIGDVLEAIAMQTLTAAEKRAQRLGLMDIQLYSWGDAARVKQWKAAHSESGS